jgi:hypothetical protein
VVLGCGCYALTFTSGPVRGKQMIVMTTNTGGDVGSNHFDLAIPDGGVGLFDGCSHQFGPGYKVGARYGGASSNQCSSLQQGCGFRWGSWWRGANNPTATFVKTACPAELQARSGCARSDSFGQPQQQFRQPHWQ